MPVVLDLVCKSCGAEFPRIAMRLSLAEARCGGCMKKSLRVSWKRGAAPGVSVFRAVQVLDGRDIASPEELTARTAKARVGMDPNARVVFDDDPAAARVRNQEIRHATWEARRAKGIDTALMAEADAAARTAQAQIERESRHAADPNAVAATYRTPSALDMAKLNRYGSTDPTPTLEAQGIAKATIDDVARPVMDGDWDEVYEDVVEPTPA